MKTTRTAPKFSKTNQPVNCRDCGKLTTREVGGCSVELCADCLRKADIENAHFDGNHDDAPCAECPECAKIAAALVEFAVEAAKLAASAPAFISFGSRYLERKTRPLGSWNPALEPYRVTRVVVGRGYHGWDSQSVTCADLAAAVALGSSAAKLPRTSKVEIDMVTSVDRYGRPSTWKDIEIRKVTPRLPRANATPATR